MATDQPEESPEAYRVNVPTADVPQLDEAPESGYCLVKYTKDGDGYCLDLSSIRLPDQQPEEEAAETNEDSDLPLEDLARKMGKEEGINTDS